ncbi:beta-glucan synthesis-associated protein [Tilletia horrida]|uniref:Beta-glucan synthesis-associated protein n=1 Tax=Tilletia horrida TaxID=155126 RepID=A0AAN6JPQ9_9BASI|nr:beta-glucan synthesis-associated protein [Tilletia horrida]
MGPSSEYARYHARGLNRSRPARGTGFAAQEKYGLPLDQKGDLVSPLATEADDYLHDPSDAEVRSNAVSLSGLLNILTLVLLTCGLLALFAGFPIFNHFITRDQNAAAISRTNGTSQVPDLDIMTIIDKETPPEAMTWTSSGWEQTTLKPSGTQYQLVFSDEFNTEGRTFWEGDDPYWTAVDLWYGSTMDLEWYSPEAINTTGGALNIAFEPMEIHNLNFRSGMLQSWNKMCFQGAYIEIAMMQPGTSQQQGFWPGMWTLGNLARPGYQGSNEGNWPYSYDSCDAGILRHQLWTNGSGPPLTQTATVPNLSAKDPLEPHSPVYLNGLPGMRFPSCTCEGEDHPGPNVRTARSAPEIDIIEAQMRFDFDGGEGHIYASQSAQIAPMDPYYNWWNATDIDYHTYVDTAHVNPYRGAALQECASVLAKVPTDGFVQNGQRFVKYGLEYSPDWDGDGNGFITWFIDGEPTWTLWGSAFRARPDINIGQRKVSTEPMSMILNFGMAPGFQKTKFEGDYAIDLPAKMLVDYVRIYQPKGQQIRTSCDPP